MGRFTQEGLAQSFTHSRRKAVLTQTNVGATDVKLEISCASTMEIDILTVGADDYAAGRTITASVLAATAGAVVERLTAAAGVAVDNQKLDLLSPSGTADGARLLGRSLVLHAGDVVFVQAAALAQNETLTVWIRAYGATPVVTNKSAAGVTLATTSA